MKLTDDERLLLDVMISTRNEEINDMLSQGADSEDLETDIAIYNLLRKLSRLASYADADAMVNRFLGWPLPKTFYPDCGISFDGRKDDEWNKNKTWPVGTNLFTAVEAKAMFEHCLASDSSSNAKDSK